MRCEDAAVATHAEHDGSVIGTNTTSTSTAARSYRSFAHSRSLGQREHRHDSDIDADARRPAKAVVPSIMLLLPAPVMTLELLQVFCPVEIIGAVRRDRAGAPDRTKSPPKGDVARSVQIETYRN